MYWISTKISRSVLFDKVHCCPICDLWDFTVLLVVQDKLKDECLSLDCECGCCIADWGIMHCTALTRLCIFDKLERILVTVAILSKHSQCLKQIMILKWAGYMRSLDFPYGGNNKLNNDKRNKPSITVVPEICSLKGKMQHDIDMSPLANITRLAINWTFDLNLFWPLNMNTLPVRL